MVPLPLGLSLVGVGESVETVKLFRGLDNLCKTLGRVFGVLVRKQTLQFVPDLKVVDSSIPLSCVHVLATE